MVVLLFICSLSLSLLPAGLSLGAVPVRPTFKLNTGGLFPCWRIATINTTVAQAHWTHFQSHFLISNMIVSWGADSLLLKLLTDHSYAHAHTHTHTRTHSPTQLNSPTVLPPTPDQTFIPEAKGKMSFILAGTWVGVCRERGRRGWGGWMLPAHHTYTTVDDSLAAASVCCQLMPYLPSSSFSKIYYKNILFIFNLIYLSIIWHHIDL